MPALTKHDFIRQLATAADVTQNDCARVLNAALDLIQSELAAGNEVNFINFGSFSVQAVAARKCQNPKTGEAITIPAQNKVKFKPGKALKAAVN